MRGMRFRRAGIYPMVCVDGYGNGNKIVLRYAALVERLLMNFSLHCISRSERAKAWMGNTTLGSRSCVLYDSFCRYQMAITTRSDHHCALRYHVHTVCRSSTMTQDEQHLTTPLCLYVELTRSNVSLPPLLAVGRAVHQEQPGVGSLRDVHTSQD